MLTGRCLRTYWRARKAGRNWRRRHQQCRYQAAARQADLQPPLLAVGQLGDQAVSVRGQADQAECGLGLRAGLVHARQDES